MINKFISGLSAGEKKILTIAGVIVIFALFDRLLLGPALGRIKEIDESIVKEESVIRQNLHFLNYRERIEKEAGQFKDFYAKRPHTEEEIIADFLKRVEYMASQTSIQLSKISPAGQELQSDYAKYFVSVDTVGTLEALTRFIYSINNTKELFKVEKMSLNANAKNAENVQATLTISRMIISNDPKVDATKLIKGAKAQDPQAAAATK